MKRRRFIEKSLVYTGGLCVINGVTVHSLRGMDNLRQSAQISKNNRILVIIQLHGGNDGLNTVIPIQQYREYYNLRPNLALSETGSRKYLTLDTTLPDALQTGLHPDMKGFKELYDSGRLAIIQNVGYENMNGSHFKGRDIWFGGVGASDPISSGWMGRYLQLEYEQNGLKLPDSFPNENMPYPLGLEFSNEVSLGFNTENTVPAAISIPNPATFFDLVTDLAGYNDEIKIDPRGFPPEPIKNSLYGAELEWILGIENGTDKYAKKLQEAYRAGNAIRSSAVYNTRYPLAAPKGSLYNSLGNNLQIIAKLISGGCSTKIYLVRIGGFDTHVRQVENYNNSYGIHAALMYHVSESMRAFQDDLRSRNIEDKVITVTMSEFGRRAVSNNSYGSDHGTVAPLFVMGSNINPGLIGNHPDLKKVAEYGGNLSDQAEDIIDFRVVFSTILQDWFELPNSQVPMVFPTLSALRSSSWGNPDVSDKIPLFRNLTTSYHSSNVMPLRCNILPNPAHEEARLQIILPAPTEVYADLLDTHGNKIHVFCQGHLPEGTHFFSVPVLHLPKGLYTYRVKTIYETATKKWVLQ